MKSSRTILKALLIFGAAYYFAAGVAHFLEQKVAFLFIYYNVASFAYQNKIIALLCFGWTGFYILGYFLVQWNKVKYLILHIASGVFAIIAFITINTNGDLSILSGFNSSTPYWIAVIIMSVYLAALTVFYLLSLKKIKGK